MVRQDVFPGQPVPLRFSRIFPGPRLMHTLLATAPGTLAALALFSLASHLAFAETYYVNPGAAWPGNGSYESPFTDWNGVSFVPGNSYLQRSGTSIFGTIYLAVQGSSAEPVVVGAYGDGAAPILAGQIILLNAAYCIVKDFEVRGSQGPGVQLLAGCHHIEVRNLVISSNMVGISVAADAGAANLIANSRVYENDLSGIAVAGGQTGEGMESVISGNTIYRNGMHGIQVQGNHYIVDGNEIHNNGLSGIPGTSGIHIYSPAEGQAFGQFNIILNNLISHQHDPDGFDGNGIQLDHYSYGNRVYNNIAFNNDGAGIFLLATRNNQVHDNLSYGNMRDPGYTRSARGEIALTCKSQGIDRTDGNFILNNTFIATNPAAACAFLDVETSDNTNLFGGNVLYHEGAGALWAVAEGTNSDIGAWNAFATGGGDDVLYDPASQAFVVPASPPPSSCWMKRTLFILQCYRPYFWKWATSLSAAQHRRQSRGAARTTY